MNTALDARRLDSVSVSQLDTGDDPLMASFPAAIQWESAFLLLLPLVSFLPSLASLSVTYHVTDRRSLELLLLIPNDLDRAMAFSTALLLSLLKC